MKLPTWVLLALAAVAARANATDYYVNDDSLTNDVYCTAVGLNTNDGLSPATPRRDLMSIINNYALGPGDRVFIDTGTYYSTVGATGTQFLITTADDGDATNRVEFIGSTLPGGTRVSAYDSSAETARYLFGFRVEGAYITLRYLNFTDGAIGMSLNAAADNVIVEHCISNNHPTVVSGPSTFRGIGYLVDGPTSAVIRNCVAANNDRAGIWAGFNGTGTTTDSISCEYYNNTLVNNASGSTGDIGGLVIWNWTTAVTIRNNIVQVGFATTQGIFADVAGAGFSSDYNNVYVVLGNFGKIGASTYADLGAWQLGVPGQDVNSLSSDPQFVSSTDFHLKSQYGHLTVSGSTPTITVAWARDAAVTSPCIDAASNAVADPAAYKDFAEEPEDNGNRRDMGAYGGTWQSSHSYVVADFPDNTWVGAANPASSSPNSAANQWPSGLDQRTSWNSHGNWVHGIPTSANDQFGRVIISRQFAAVDPQLDVTATVYSVNILYVGNPTLNVNHATAYTLTTVVTFLTGSFFGNDGTLNVTTGTVSVGTTFTNNGVTTLAGGTVISAGNFVNNGTVTHSLGTLEGRANVTLGAGYSGTGGTIKFTGMSNQTFTTSANTINAMEVNNTGVAGSNTISQSGNFTLTTSVTFVAGILDLGAGTRTITGAQTIAAGRLKITGGTTTFSGAVTASAVLELVGAVTANFNGGAGTPPVALTISGGGSLISSGLGGSRPTLTRGAGDWQCSATGTLDINGAIFNALGDPGLVLQSGVTINNLNDVTFQNGPGGGAVYIRIPAANTGAAYTFRSCEFTAPTDATVQRNIQVVAPSTTTVRVENAIGNKGKRDTVSSNGVGGEENDLDPGDSDSTADFPTSSGQIVWVYFRWRWLGEVNANWSDTAGTPFAANWERDGARASSIPFFPDANTEDVLIDAPVVPGNNCTMDGIANRTVRDISLASGGTLNAANTLFIWGTAFKSTGGTFTPAAGSWVEFTGAIDQTVIILGGSGAFENLRVNKSAGSAVLGSNLTVNSALSVVLGTFSLGTYTLTQNGNVTVSTGSAATFLIGSSASLSMTGTTTLTVGASGTLTVSGNGQANLGNGTHSVSGTLNLQNTAVLRLPDSASAILNVSGTINTTQTSSSARPTITWVDDGAPGYLFQVNLTGTVDINGLNYSRGGSSGLTISAAATIANLHYVSFTNGAPAGSHMTLTRDLDWAYTSNNGSFDTSTTRLATLAGVNDAGVTRKLNFSAWSLSGGSVSDPDPGTGGNVEDDEANGRDIVFYRQVTWNGKWRYRRQITITNPAGGSAATLPSGAGVEITIDHQTLVTAGKSLASGDDLRIVYDTGVGDAVEIDRVLISAPDTTTTRIHFATQAALADGASSSFYYLYYGATAANAASPPSSVSGAGLLVTEGWESGSFGTWTATSTWTVNTASPFDRTFHADVPSGGGVASLSVTSAAMSTVGVTGLRPRWAWRYANGAGGADDLYFQWSTNDFAAVNTVATLTANTAYTDTKSAGILAAGAEGNANFKVRWLFTRNFTTDTASADLFRISVNNIADDATFVVSAAEQTIGSLWSDPMNWTGGGMIRPRPSATDDVTVDGLWSSVDAASMPCTVSDGTAGNVAYSIASLRLGETTAATLTFAGGDTLSAANNFVLGASGTLQFPAGLTTPATALLSVGNDLDHRGTLDNAIDLDEATIAAQLLIGRDWLVSGSPAFTGGSISLAEINLRRNLADASAGLQYPGILRMRGPASGSATVTLDLPAAARIRWIKVQEETAGTYIVQPASGDTVTCERVEILVGDFEVPAGTTLTVTDIAPDATFNTAAADRRIRFNSTTAPATKRFVVSGGTVTTPALGAPATNGNVGTFRQEGGTVTVSGDVTFRTSDSVASSTAGPALELTGGTLNVAGNWDVGLGTAGGTAPPTMSATGGTVAFNGSVAQTIRHTVAGGLWNLTVGNTAAEWTDNEVYMTSSFTVQNVLTVSDGFFAIHAQTLTLSGTSVTHTVAAAGSLFFIRDNFAVGASDSTLLVGNGSTISVDGRWRMIRNTQNDTGLPILDAAGGGANSYALQLNSASTSSFQYFTIRRLNADGLAVKKGAELAILDEGRFENNNGVYLNFRYGASTLWPDGSDRVRIVRAMANVTFTGASGQNVRTSSGTPTIQFLGNATDNGPRWGASFADDPFGRLKWLSGSVKRMTSDTASDASYDTIRQAFLANLAADTRFRMDRGVVSCENIDLNALGLAAGVDHILENASLSAGLDSPFIDRDADTTPRLTLRNCVLDTWGADELTLQNCTLFRSGQFSWLGLPGTTNSTLTNCIREISNAGVTAIVAGNLDLRTADGGTYFLNVGSSDFHLRSTATLAIDEGAALTYGWDFEGEGTGASNQRGFDGKVGGTASNWDLGADEFMGSAVTPRLLTEAPTGALAAASTTLANLGAVTRFHFVGSTRGDPGVSGSGYSYAYVTTGNGGSANNNTLLLVRWDATRYEIVQTFTAPAPVVNMSFWVDNNTATTNWRAFIWLVLDGYIEQPGAAVKGQDGLGDCIMLLVDKGNAANSGLGEIVHPTGTIGDADYANRRFGEALYQAAPARYVFRPGTISADSEEVAYRIQRVTLATIVGGPPQDDNLGVLYNSPVNENRAKWLRMYFSARKSTGTQPDAGLFKLNADPYDSNDNGGGGNRAFGRAIWAIVRNLDGGVDNDTTASWYNYDYRGGLTFTWDSGFQEIFVPVSDNPAATGPERTLLVRYAMGDDSAPGASRNWQATEQALPVDENRFGGTLDNGNAGAAITYGASDGHVIYNRSVVSGSGSQGLWWATRLKDASGNPTSPVVAPQRFWPNAFALVGFDGGVNKIWNVEAAKTTLTVAVLAGDPVISVSSTVGFPASGKIYIQGDEIDYTGTNGTQFTGCTGALAHPDTGTAILSPAAKKNGALASTGLKLEPDGDGDPTNNEVAEANTLDPDWPLACVGKPVDKIWVRGTKLYWGTDRGYVYGWNWNRDGSSIAGGNETIIPGYPYVIPGAKVTWIFVHPNAKVLIGTDTGALYQFEP